MSRQPFFSQLGFLNREIIVAIILGFSIGLVVTYGIWTANRSLKDQQAISSPIPGTITPSENSNTTSPNLAETRPAANELSLIQPEPYTLTDTNTLTLSGFAPQGSTIILLTEAGNHVLTLNQDNEFESEIKLITGINYLTIFAIHPDGNSERIDRTVVLSS